MKHCLSTLYDKKKKNCLCLMRGRVFFMGESGRDMQCNGPHILFDV